MSVGQIALFGTSADPPTRGHQALLCGLLEHFPQVATWASDNPLKEHTAPLAMRHRLLEALVEAINDPRLRLHQELSSPWAITTLERAAELWPKAELVFVVGSDLAPQIPRWKQGAALLRGCRLAIAPRLGSPMTAAGLKSLHDLGGRLEILPLSIPATSSSTVRQQPDASAIPASVWPIVMKHNLYGFERPQP